MKLLKQIKEIDNNVEKMIEQENNEILLSNGILPESGLALNNSSVPWVQNVPWALNHDFDFDGIPDALDNFNGSGAFDND